MKILRSKRTSFEVVAPVRGGYRVRFEGGKAAVPDEVADVLVAMGQGFYTVAIGDADSALTEARVLVIRDMGLGDVLLTTPLIRKLDQEYGATVDVLTSDRYRCVFDHNPYARSVLALEYDDGRRDAWDVVLDLRHHVEHAENAGVYRHRADAFCEYADIRLDPDERRLDYFLTDEEKTNDLVRSIRDMGETHPEQIGTIAYVLRTSCDNRHWSGATHRQMIRALIKAGYGVILFDHELQPVYDDLHDFQVEGRRSGTWPWGTYWNAAGDLKLRDALAVIAACDACLTPDTGLFHAAGALGVPTIAYFGAFPADERHAHERLTVLNEPGNCGLMPCHSYRCLNREADGQARCLSVSPERVIAALDEALGVEREGTHFRFREAAEDPCQQPAAV